MILTHFWAKHAPTVLFIGLLIACTPRETSRSPRGTVGTGFESKVEPSTRMAHDTVAVSRDSTLSFSSQTGSKTERVIGVLGLGALIFALFIVGLIFIKMI